MAGYIGSKSSVTQVDGYSEAEADAEFVTKAGDTMSGNLDVTGTVTADGLTVDGSSTLDDIKLTSVALPSSGNPSIALRNTDNNIYIQTGSGNAFSLLDSSQNSMYNVSPTLHSFNISNTERMRLDSSGRVTMPYQPAFLAHGNSGTYYSVSSLGHGSYIPFANAVTNIGNCFNPSNSRFSAPVAGMYHFDVAVYTRTGSATEDIYPRFRVNNSSNKGYTYWYNTTGSEVHHTITDSINIYLNAGDDLGITINGNANSDIYLGFQETRFSGYLLG